MLPTESFFVDWRWLLMNDTESLAAPCRYLITLMIGTLVVLGLMKILSRFFLEVTSLVYVHPPTLWCNIAQTTILGFASFTETATGPHWFSLPPHPLLKTFRYVWYVHLSFEVILACYYLMGLLIFPKVLLYLHIHIVFQYSIILIHSQWLQ